MASARWQLGGIGDAGAGGQSSKTSGAWQTGHRLLQPPGLNS